MDFKKTDSAEDLSIMKNSISDNFFDGKRLLLPPHLTIVKWKAPKEKINKKYLHKNLQFNLQITTTGLSKSMDGKSLWFEVQDEHQIRKVANELKSRLLAYNLNSSDIFILEKYHVSVVHNIQNYSKLKKINIWLEKCYPILINNGLTLETENIHFCQYHEKKGWFINYTQPINPADAKSRAAD